MLTLSVNIVDVNLDVNKKMKHWFMVTTTANPYTTDVLIGGLVIFRAVQNPKRG